MQILRILLGLITAAIALVLTTPIIIGILFFKTITSVTKLLAALIEPDFVTWQELIEFHPTIGWRSKPNLNTCALVDDVFHFTTDADGWRGNQTNLKESDMVVFGDSHAFGYGIDERNFFANLTRRPRVKSVGVISYNIVQEVMWMRELSHEIKGKSVVWLVFPGNDLLEDLEPTLYHYRIPFVRELGTSQWEIVTEHLSPAPSSYVSRRCRETNYDRLTKIYSPTFLSERAFAACEYLVTEAANICNRAKAQLIVVTVPDPMTLSEANLGTLYAHGADPKTFDPALPDKRIRSMCEKLNLPFVAGTDYFGIDDYKERDSHWNKSGHLRMAKLLDSLCEKVSVLRQREAAEELVSQC